MYCGAGEISVLYTLHALIGESMQQYVIYSTLLGILLAITSMAGVNANLTTINAVIDLLSIGPVFKFETLQNVLVTVSAKSENWMAQRKMLLCVRLL